MHVRVNAYGCGSKISDIEDKYLDTSWKILSLGMLVCNMKALIFII